MATAKDYFTQATLMQLGRVFTMTMDAIQFETESQVVQDYEGGSKYAPNSSANFVACV